MEFLLMEFLLFVLVIELIFGRSAAAWVLFSPVILIIILIMCNAH